MPSDASERCALKMLHIEQICVDEGSAYWEMHYSSNAKLPENLLEKLAQALCEAFSLSEVKFISEDQVKEATKTVDENINTNTTIIEPKEDIPLPEEPSMDEYASFTNCNEALDTEATTETTTKEAIDDPEYLQAMENLYGQKKDDSQLWGKKVRVGKPRDLAHLWDEEYNVVIEGKFVKTYLPDGSLETFVEKETKTGNIIISFSLYDGEGGINIKKIFSKPFNRKKNSELTAEEQADIKKQAKEYKSLLKLGMNLRIQGDAHRDQYTDEMTLMPTGIQKLPDDPTREDHAEVKRVEIHCHTKMSKMDGVTPMKDLVRQAIKFGHKALAITDHGVVQAFPFCFDEVMDQKSDLK